MGQVPGSILPDGASIGQPGPERRPAGGGRVTGPVGPEVSSTRASRSGRFLGIDAAGKLGWAGVLLDASGYLGATSGSLADVVAWAEPVDVIGIDIPIGHMPVGTRLADREARRFVRPRGSSVFAAPPTHVLSALSYAAANDLLTSEGRPKLTRQAWALVPKILEAATFAELDGRAYEVHPEVSFRELAGKPLEWSKKSWNGLVLRRHLLAGGGVHLPDAIPELGDTVSDDVVDAAVVAWSARRIGAGTARPLPDPPEEHAGRRIAIWR
jgi:predicted RNase H-like nuclease